MSKENDKFVLQTRLFVIMRRVLTRVIDLEYFRTDYPYAAGIVQLAEDSGDADLIEVAGKLRQLMDIPVPQGTMSHATIETPPQPETRTAETEADPSTPVVRYVGALR